MGAEIRNAVNSGKEVTVHEEAINAYGWSGYRYIIIDPDTGAGGYIIEGKGNGGALFGLAIGLISGLAIILAGPFVAGLVGAIGFLVGVYFALFGANKFNLDFSAARLIGVFFWNGACYYFWRVCGNFLSFDFCCGIGLVDDIYSTALPGGSVLMKKNDEERIKNNMSIMGAFIFLEAIIVAVATIVLWLYK